MCFCFWEFHTRALYLHHFYPPTSPCSLHSLKFRTKTENFASTVVCKRERKRGTQGEGHGLRQGGLLRNSRGQENCGQRVQGSGAAAAGQICALPAWISQDWQAEESQDGGGKDHGRENSLGKQQELTQLLMVLSPNSVALLLRPSEIYLLVLTVIIIVAGIT